MNLCTEQNMKTKSTENKKYHRIPTVLSGFATKVINYTINQSEWSLNKIYICIAQSATKACSSDEINANSVV